MGLLQIQTAANAANAAVRLHPSDNVAIARVPLGPGQPVSAGGAEIPTRGTIPAGHKVALRAIAAGERVIRYGAPIGIASVEILPGDHVHTHNLRFDPTAGLPETAAADGGVGRVQERAGPTFLGYPRADGRAGTRNYIAVAAASNCASHAAELIAGRFAGASLPEGVDGVVAFPHGEGCGHSPGPDTEQLHRVIAGVLDHPNVSAGLLLGLGCEMNQVTQYFPDASLRMERLVGLTLQSSGGTGAVVDAAAAEVGRLIDRAASERRAPVPASKIVLGLNCGGSDSFSGVSANPALGACVDRVAALGGAAVLAETTEIFGAESLLLRRAVSREVAEKLLECVRGYKRYLAQFGGSFDDNPTPGNKEGGLTNIVEKSLGAVAKGGSAALTDVVGYAERVRTPGLVFMNTPGYDPVSLTGLAAGGVNLIAFTTGRGSAIGFPTVPVMKIASNSGVFERLRDNMDVNAGRIMDGEATVEQVGEEILALLLEVASGRRTSSERWGHREFVPWRIGPVL
jgi:altronate hydrolase